MACVDLPAFPLQILMLRHPDWRERPAAIVDSDKPQGRILWVNELARKERILPGMRYAAALSLSGSLRAASVSEREISRALDSIGERLRHHTPGVEPASAEPGVFWVDASGLERLHDSLTVWAERIRSDLQQEALEANLTVGYSRFGTYAVARSRPGIVVFETPEDERVATRRVSLDRLAFDPRVRDTLARLGLRTVGDFLDLPAEGVHKRFGPEISRLHRLAAGALDLPLQPERVEPPAQVRSLFDESETSVQRILAVLERQLPPLLRVLAERGQALAELHVGFRFERLGDHIERIRPASPTLDAGVLLELVRLRLEALRTLPDGVAEIALVADAVAATREQVQLFVERPRRDLAAANRALARVRAELGNEAVTRARLREGHLPEAAFGWEALDAVVEPRPRESGLGRLVRRIYVRPQPLPSRERQEPDGWMLRGLEQGPVVRVQGPYVVSGGWWQRAVHREYHFAETQKGELLWVYYDRHRRSWYLHGRVE